MMSDGQAWTGVDRGGVSTRARVYRAIAANGQADRDPKGLYGESGCGIGGGRGYANANPYRMFCLSEILSTLYYTASQRRHHGQPPPVQGLSGPVRPVHEEGHAEVIEAEHPSSGVAPVAAGTLERAQVDDDARVDRGWQGGLGRRRGSTRWRVTGCQAGRGSRGEGGHVIRSGRTAGGPACWPPKPPGNRVSSNPSE
jgi:hypothetical protein